MVYPAKIKVEKNKLAQKIFRFLYKIGKKQEFFNLSFKENYLE